MKRGIQSCDDSVRTQSPCSHYFLIMKILRCSLSPILQSSLPDISAKIDDLLQPETLFAGR